jgi:hypothetical protein
MAEGSPTDSFGAKATAGASAGKVAVAGSLAINIVRANTATATIAATSSVKAGGGAVALTATDTADSVADAEPENEGATSTGKLGVGASIALNITPDMTSATVGNSASLSDVSDVTLMATGTYTETTTAVNGAKATDGTGIGISAAIAIVNNGTMATLGTASSPLVMTGALEAMATQTDTVTTSANGKAAGGNAVGIAIAVNVVPADAATASTARSIEAGGAVKLVASSINPVTGTAMATAAGGQQSDTTPGSDVNSQVDNQMSFGDTEAANSGSSGSTDGATAPSASSSDGKVSLAGAVAVNVVNNQATATILNSLTVTAGGLLTVSSANTTGATASADGSATGSGSAGIGVAVALNVATVVNTATIGTNDMIDAQGLDVTALMAGSNNPTHTISATATSGAGAGTDGASKVGVAGAVAINVVTTDKTMATIGTGSTASAGSGDITFGAQSTEADTANATSMASGSEVGVGASLALNILLDGRTIAEVSDGAGLTGGDNLNVSATSSRKVLSTVGAGTKGGIAVSPAVAIAIVKNTTTAQLGTTTGSPLELSGNAMIQAMHTGSTEATGNANAAGNDVAVGATVGVNVATDDTTAATNRNITAAGFVTIASQSTITSSAVEQASTQGNAGNESADSESSSETNNNLNNQGQSGTSLPSANSESTSASSDASSESGKGSGGVGVAAAIAVNWETATNTASVGTGAQVSAMGGAATVSALDTTNASAQATGTSLNLTASESKVNVGAGVALNVTSSSNSAIVGSSAQVHGQGIDVVAATPTGAAPNTIKALAAAASGGVSQNAVAASAAINVISYSAEANVNSSAELESLGGITVNAASPIALQGLAASGAFGTGNAVGAAAAINVVTNTTEAFLGNNVTADASGPLAVTATASIVPIQVTLPLIPSSLLPSITAVAISGAAGAGTAAIAGSVIVQVFTLNTHAYIGQGAQINQNPITPSGPNQSIMVKAQDDTTIQNGAGSLGANVGGSVGFGIALDVEVISKDTYAYIGASAKATAGGSVTVQATSTEPIFAVAASAGVTTGQVGAAGSIVVVVLDEGSSSSKGTSASIGAGATVTAGGNMIVAAADNASPSDKFQLLAGGIAFGSTAGFGIASTILVKLLTLDAQIGQGAHLFAEGPAGLSVTATTQENLTTIAVAGAGAGTAAIAGSATVNVLKQSVHAEIDQGAMVDASQATAPNPNSVTVTATDNTSYLGVAGALAIGGTAGIGAGVDVGVITKDTEAWVAKQSMITANRNVAIASVSSEGITSISAGAAGAGTAAIALNAGVSVLSPTTKAYIDGGMQPTDGATVTTDGSVTVAANERTTMNVISGNLTFSGVASIGAAAGVPIVNKTTEAYIGQNAHITAKGNASNSTVDTGLAASTTPTTFNPQTAVQPDGQSINLGFNPGFTTGEAVYYYTDGGNPIGNLPSSTPTSGGNPQYIVYYVIAGVNPANPDVIQLATSHDNAMNRIAITGLNGSMATGTMHRIVPTTEVTVQNVGTTQKPSSETTALAGDLLALTGQTLVSPTVNQQFQGVAVTAMNQDQIATAGVSGGGAGVVAVNVGGSVDVMTSKTLAHIDTGAQINAVNTGASATQSVIVAAANNYQQLGIAGALAISGTVSVAPGADVRVVNNTTKATIADGTVVNANDDVRVLARAAENVLSIAAGIAGSGAVAVGGAVAVTVVNDTTWATMGANTATTPGAGAQVSAGGNVFVNAEDDTTYNAFTGAAGIGIGIAGLGASVGVLVVTKDTEAYVGNNSVVNANANSPDTLNNINQDENTATGTVNQISIKGLAVQAVSSEKMLTAAIAAGAGFFAGIAGAVTVEIIGSDTKAYIGPGSVVNAAPGAGPGQAVYVTAFNDAEDTSAAGGLGGGIVGIGGAVDIGLVQNNTSAYIGAGAKVNATGDVDVNALSKKNVESDVISAAFGIAAAAGSVTVWTLGTNFTSSYSDGTQVTDRGTWQPNTSYNQNDLVTGSNGVVYIAQNTISFSNDLNPTQDTQNVQWRQAAWNSGTAYTKGQLVLGSNGTIYVAKQNNTGVDPTTDSSNTDWRPVTADSLDSGKVTGFADTQSGGGSTEGGFQSIVGNGFKPDNSGNPNTSQNRIASNLSGTASPWMANTAYAQGDVVEGSNNQAYMAVVNISAANDLNPTSDITHTQWQPTTLTNATSSIDSAAPQNDVSGAIAKTSVPAGTSAFIDANATVTSGGSVSVLGKEKLGYSALAGSFAVGGVGLGASIGIATIKSNTDAGIRAGATVSAGPRASNTIHVNAALNDTTTGSAFGGQAGIVALGAQVIVLNDNSTQNAHIDNGANIKQAGGGLAVEADATRSVTPKAVNAQGGGLAIGAAVAIGNVGGFTLATVGSAKIGQAPGMSVGGLTVKADSNVTDTAMTVAATAGIGLLAANGSAAVADDDPTITATVGPDATITLTGAATVEAIAEGNAQAMATGIAVAAGAGLGLSLAFATLTPSVTAGIGADSSVTTTTGGVTVVAASNDMVSVNPANDTVSANPDGNTISATAIAGSGGVLAALSGAIATATLSPTVNAYVGDPADAAPYASTTISAAGNVNVSALSSDIASSKAVGVAVAGLVGITGSGASTTVGGQVTAQLNGNVSRGQSVTVAALATGSSTAEIDAGAAGLLGGVLNLGSAILSTGVMGLIGNSAVINVTGAVADIATSDGTATASGLAFSLGLAAFGIVVTMATLIPSVKATIGTNASITAGGGITVMAIHDATPGASGAPPQPVAGTGAFATSEAPLNLGVVSADGAVPTATAQATVGIEVGSGTTLSSGGDIRIEADATNTAEANATAGAFGALVSHGTSNSNATAGGGTTAQLDGSVSKANNFFLDSNAINSAQTTAEATAGGLFGGIGAEATSVIPTTATTQADAGAGSGFTGIAQTALIQATAQNNSGASASGLTIHVVAVGSLLATATDEARTAAYSLGNFGGNTFNINVQASDSASTSHSATAGHLIDASPDNVDTTTVTPTVGAAIGGDPLDSSVAAATDTVTATGNVGVTATDNPEGDAETSNSTFGGIASGGALTNDTISPTVTSFVGTGTTIRAGGNVTVSATGTPLTSGNVPNYNILSVNTTNNTLKVLNNGIQAGQTVLYDNEGNTPIQGLVGETQGSSPNGMRAYSVLPVDTNDIQFGSTFSGSEQGAGTSGVNSANSTINFPTVANFQSGDLVQYEPVGSAPPIPGLTPGGKYYVEVLSATSIRLTNSQAQAVVPQSFLKNFTISSIGADDKTITIANNGFTKGEAVTFQPMVQPQQFQSTSVNVYATYDNMGNPTLHAQSGANDIFISQNPFQNGDTIVYQVVGSGNAIGGLISGHTYQVVSDLTNPSDPNDPNLIQLKDLQSVSSVTFAPNSGGDTITRNDGGTWSADGFAANQQISVSGAGNDSGTYTIASLNGSEMVLTAKNQVKAETDSNVTFVGPVVALTPDTSTAGASVVHQLSEAPISPLTTGNTYYVTNVNSAAGTFQLASSPTDATNGVGMTLNTGGIGANTVFQVGPQGIPITSSSGTQELVIVLGPSSTVSGTQRLLGPGGASLSLVFPTVGDGISTGSTHGNAGGFVGEAHNVTTVTASPTVSAAVNGPLLTAGGNISVTSTSNINAAAHGDNGAVGFIGIGTAVTTNNETNSNDASVGTGTMIDAGGNFTLAATSSNTNNADTSTSAGAGISQVKADTTAQVNYDTLATVGQNACIAAAGQIKVVASTSTNGASSASATGAGFGAGGYANQNGGQGSVIGQGGMSNAENQTEISKNASLFAQSVILGALVPSVAMTAYGNAYGAGFVGVGKASGNFTMNAENNVLIDSGASVTGTAGVDVLPKFENINGSVTNPASADATSEGAFGFVSATANNNTQLVSTASSAPTALVVAGPRGTGNPPDGLQHPDPTQYSMLALFVDTTPGTINSNQSGAVHRKAIAAGTDHEDGSTNLNQLVPWFANVTILSNTTTGPTLIIGPTGNVIKQIGITFTISGNTIIVNDIAGAQTGQVFFDSLADTTDSNVGNTTDDISGSGATWTFVATLGAVTIINESPMNLEINNVNVVNTAAGTMHDVTLLAGSPFNGSSYKTPITGSIELTFAIKHIAEPTLVTIKNLGGGPGTPLLSPGLILNGTINNPIGTTIIFDMFGSITSTHPRGVVGPDGRTSLIVTNILDIEAPNGSIGTLADRINIDLVQSLDVDTNLTRPTKLTAIAGGSVYFDLQGVLRDPNIINFIVNVDSITAGQNIDVLLQGSLQETKLGPGAAGISIFASAPKIMPIPTPQEGNPIDFVYFNFFHPDTAGGSGLDLGVFADPNQAVPIFSTYNFRSLDSQQNRTLPGLIAGGNISVHAANPATTVPSQIIHIIGITELKGTGFISAITSGNITLNEMTGFAPMRIETVVSTVGDVKLTVPDTPNPGDDLLILPNGQISAPGGITAPPYSAPQVAPTVNPTGGNTPAVNPSGTGPATVTGSLAPGTYYVVYTFTFPNGSQSLASPASQPFKVAAGNIPQVTLPLLPVGATGYNIYLSNSSATPGSATLYTSAVTVSAVNLQNAAPTGQPTPPATNPITGAPTVTPTVNPTGGGATGGTLSPGTYFVFYTSVGASGTQSPPSPSSAPFVVAAGNIPQVALPPLSGGATGYDLYLSDTGAQSGSAVLYAAGITTTTLNLSANPPNGQVAQPVNNVATVVPTVNPTGGNSQKSPTGTTWVMPGSSGMGMMTGLAPGRYYVVYTFTYPSNAETFASPQSATFTVTAGNIPAVMLPPLPPGASGINLYLSDSNADPGSATRYFTGITSTTFYMTFPAPPNGVMPPTYDLAPITPKVNVVGGNAYGGNLLPGTYYLFYTFTFPNGAESTPSPQSARFTVAPGNIPQVSLPPLPPGATGYNIYLSDPVGNQGSATLYAAGVTTTTYNFQRNALSQNVFPPAINFPTAAPTVRPTGGGTTGGQLAPGTYILQYTFVKAAGAETYTSPFSVPFAVVAGDIPQVTLPPLPGGVFPGATTAYNIYLSGPTGSPTSVIRYAAGVTGTTFNLASAAPTGDTVRPPAPTPATVAPLVQALGGGPTGGHLAPGTYFVYYTYTYSNGTESANSPSSAYFTVAPGYIPLVTLPPLPVSATGYNLYLSDPSADPGSALRYASGITTTTWTLANAVPPSGINPPSAASATVAPTVKPTGGGATGGHLAPGTYYVLYTFTYPNNTESYPSPISATFTVAAGNIPAVMLPALPAGATGYNIYLSNSAAAAGSAASYITGITTSVVNLAAAAPSGAIAPPTNQQATVAPTVNPVGGSPFGGRLLPGTYIVFYTFTYPNGVETLPSSSSAPLTVGAGNVPLATLPVLPVGATGINLYLSDATGGSGPAVRYATGIKTTAYLMPYDAPVNGADRPANPIATVAATVNPTGGGTTGGQLAPGTYFLFYTFNYQGNQYPVGVESAPSPASLPFTVTAGEIPQVSLPLLPVGVLPVGALSYNIYLSDSSADPNTATRYASGFTGTTFNLFLAATPGAPRPPLTNIGTIAPTVAPAGGGTTGGNLPAGTYFVLYTFAYANGTETLPSPSSANFTVSPGNVPQITLPPLPAGAIGYNIYLSNASATPGSATRYAADITTSTYELSSATTVAGVSRPLNPAATVAPTVLPAGGGTTNGNLAAGTYYVLYTFTYPSGAESFGSPSSAPFTVAAGAIPQVILPPLPNGATGYDIYLSDPSADPGSAVRYAAGVTSSIIFLQDAAPDGGLPLPPTNLASVVPKINPTGGGTTGGQLLPGTYNLVYTFTYPNGAESFTSPLSANFAVAAGQIPQVALPPLATGASGYNIYLSDDAANVGSLTLYATGITTTTYNLKRNALSQNTFPPTSGPAPTVPLSEALPTVNATGGGTTGGHLAPGTYFVFYSPTSAQGFETYLSASSTTFTVAAGNIPQLSLPPVPDGDSGFDIYLSDSSAHPGSGTIYASGVTTTTFNLQWAAHAGGAASLLVGDNVTIPAPTLVNARQSVTVRGDHGNADPSVGTTINVDSAIVAPQVLLTGENDNDTFNVQATAPSSFVTMFTGAGANTINMGSKQPQPYAGIIDNFQGAELILGSGNDTANVDDTGSPGPKTGFLTAAATPAGQVGPAGALTGLNMGAPGIAYSGLSNLNITLGAGGMNQPTSPVLGNTFGIDVPGGLNLPHYTTVFGGPSNNDAVTGVWGSNFNTVLNLYRFEHGTIAVGVNFTGTMNALLPGSLQQVTVGTSMTPGSILNAGSVGTMTVGPNHFVFGDNLAGIVNVLGELGSLSVAGGTPGSIAAGSIGTIAVYGGYGPIVAQIKEDGIQRQINASAPNYPYPAPNPAALPTLSGTSYVNFKYFYEGLDSVLGNPQLTAEVTNGVGTVPDQYDFALITDNDVAKFNLALLYASGVAGVRNVEVEGDLLTTITAAAQSFFGLPSNTGGVRLPSDNLGGVEVRDYAPPDSIQAKSIQGVSFGSTTRFTINHVVYGSMLVASDAANLLVLGTAIVQAADTFLVPFADLMNQQVGFFIDDVPNTAANAFDNNDVVFTVQSDNGQQENADRGAVTALVTVAKGSYIYSPTLVSSIIQTIDLRGDGGSLTSRQWVAQGITSTGPIGDVAVNVTLGLNDVTAPSFFGNINSYGPIAGTVQSTGVRVDPIFGTTATASADIGRTYVTLGANGQPAVTTTTIQADINGRPAFGPMGLVGRIISRRNVISRVAAAGGIYGTIVAQGDIGAFSPLLSRTNLARVGGIATDTTDTGQIFALGRLIGDVSLGGGLQVSTTGGAVSQGMIAVKGGILGNLKINGSIAPGAAIISGGSIGSMTLGTGINFFANTGIIAADGSIFNTFNSPTVPPGYLSSNDAEVPPPINFDAQVIDAIFSQSVNNPLPGLDILANGDLEGLDAILETMARLQVVDGHLALKPK